jgi:hypothetical protein
VSLIFCSSVVVQIAWAGLYVPETSSMSCDQVVFVYQATDASLSSDAVIVEIGRFG